MNPLPHLSLLERVAQEEKNEDQEYYEGFPVREICHRAVPLLDAGIEVRSGTDTARPHCILCRDGGACYSLAAPIAGYIRIHTRHGAKLSPPVHASPCSPPDDGLHLLWIGAWRRSSYFVDLQRFFTQRSASLILCFSRLCLSRMTCALGATFRYVRSRRTAARCRVLSFQRMWRPKVSRFPSEGSPRMSFASVH